MASNVGSGIIEASFPTGALVPKAETGVLNFLQKYPEFDGRDVTIAIFDSGVDPRATGLQTLCDGKTVKVIERFDCTGCGDVDVSKKVTADEKGFLKGISGRQLKLTKEMIDTNKANNGEFRIGLKSFHDLCPSKIRENINNAAKFKNWDKQHKIAIAEATRKAVEFETQNTETTKLPWDKKLIKDNLDNTLELLNNYEKIYNDIKTSYDCILYSTESGWHAVIDVTENGDLENALHIEEYTRTHETKNVDDYLSISINVHDEGNVLEVVGMCSSHGTHVASIASGNHSSREFDGVAPNAKIVSLTIGDGRLGSMETGTALIRAMMKVIELCRSGRKVDVINMSYGEHANWSNSGRLGELMNEVVNKYGVVWVASAGNHGPALSTVGTPPDISQPTLIGVGAYVSPQMMEAEYTMREKLPGNVYTWTSRDPCIDGGQGVTVCAPGGAITSVPQFTMSKSQLMNGTSMAAPHVAGAIALLISALKQSNIEYSPYSIKQAISVTANKLSYVDPFAQGHGLLNVEKAFEHLEQNKKNEDNMIRYSVRVGLNQAKGIHLRTTVLKKYVDYSVTIEPVFLNDKEVEPKKKFNFNVRLNLIPSHPFVQCGAFLDLSYGPRSLVVRVDPTSLPPGVHSAVVRAYDSDNVQKGSLFEIPITIIQPHVLEGDNIPVFQPTSSKNDGSIEYQPNTITRDFILVPKKATWAVLHLRSTDTKRDKELAKFFVHTNQLLPKSSCRKMETMKILPVNSEYETTSSFRVRGDQIIELCIAKYWSNYGQSNLRYSLEFRGVEAVNRDAYVMHAGRGIHKFEVSSLVSEEIQPQLQLKQASVVLKPTESKISPLSATRDVIPDGRQIYQNLLTYTLNITKAYEVALYAPIFNDLLYESEFESQLWMLFDTNKALIATGDAHSRSFYTKLDKGEYTIKLQIRHEKRDALEKISEATLIAQFKLAAVISLDLYDSYNQCVVNGRKFTSAVIKESPPKVLYTAPIAQEKHNKAYLPAQCAWLSGVFSLPKDDAGRRANLFDFTYMLTPTEKKPGNGNGNAGSANANQVAATNALKIKNPATIENGSVTTAANAASGDGANVQGEATTTPTATPSSPKKGKASVEDYIESLRDFQCSHITKCDLEQAEKIYNEVIAAHPKHLVAHLMLAQNIDSSELKAQLPLSFVNAQKPAIGDNNEEKLKGEQQKTRDALERIIKLADIVIKDTDKDELLSYYGMKTDTRSDAAKIKTNMDKQKNNLLEALVKKGTAVTKLSVLDNNTKDRLEDLNNIYTEIIKFADATDTKVISFSLWHAYANNHYGRMYKLLTKLMEDKRTRENFEELGLIASALGYEHVKTVVERMTISAFPGSFRLF